MVVTVTVTQRILGYTLFQWSTLNILLNVSNFATTCQLTLSGVLVDSQR